MFQIFKPWLIPFAFIIATQISVVRADSIRVVGPDGQIQSAPTFSEPLQRAQSNSAEPSRFYGPTRGSETLWSIASKLRPDSSVSVQQTLLAIYRLNPQAFENQNIHSLLPASNLRVPSLEQTRASSTQQAINIMNSHLAKLDKPTTKTVAAKPKSTQAPSRTDVTPKNAQSTAKVSEPKVVDKSIAGNKELVSNKPITGAKEMNHLEKQLELSETELLSLEEKNHQLRLMLSNVQSEVDGLKTELSDEDRIRSEVEKLLAEEKRKNAEIEKMAPSAMDQLLSNGWLVAALAIIPGLLLGLIIVMLLGRRSKNDEQQQTTQEQPIQPQPSSVAPITLGDEMDDLDNELSLDDELFGTEDDANKLFDDQALAEEDDVFAGLDESDLDFNLDGEDDDPFASIGENGDLDTNFDDLDLDSSNGISVNGEDKALGLEEMERALDETVESALDSDEGDFDLSDDNPMSADDIEALLAQESATEDLGSNELDQSLLDDLFALDDEDDDSFDIDALISEEQNDSTPAIGTSVTDDFDIDALISEQQAPQPSAPSVEDDIDDIFAQVAAQNEQGNDPFNLDNDDEISSSLNSGLASDDDIENILSQFEQPLENEDESALSDQPQSAPAIEQPPLDIPNLDLLDEQLEGDDVDLSNSTDLLDEMLDSESDQESEDEPLGFDALSELEELSGLSTDDELNISEDSTETLDELIGDPDDDFELDAESTDLLDDFLDSELSDNTLSTDETETQKSESLDPFDDLLTSGIEDELESEEQAFDKELDAALDLDKTSDELDSDAEITELMPVPSEVEPEQANEELLDSELTQDSADVKSEKDEDFNRDDFIDDLFGVAPATDALLDDSLETTDEALIDELMSSDSDALTSVEEPTSSSEDLVLEDEFDSPSEPTQASEDEAIPSAEALSPAEVMSSDESDELDIDSLLSENSMSDVEMPSDEALEPASSVQHEVSPSSFNDISEDDEETVEDWLAEAIDDVESSANIDSDFDFEPKIQGSDQLDDVVESLPEPEPE
ncbi:FimV/HubP family polar landmark protein, partial [Vibrio lentus]